MQNFIIKPSIDLYPGLRVDKSSVLEYKTEKVKQTLGDLVFRTETKVKGEDYESVLTTTIQLTEGDILLFMGEERGYIKPVENFCTIDEAINDFESIKDLG
jgi:K+/H+ antiporter YhaU regulatory subunit KhtT